MVKKDKDLCRIWDTVNKDHPNKSDEWRMQTTLDFYKAETEDSASIEELLDALDAREDER